MSVLDSRWDNKETTVVYSIKTRFKFLSCSAFCSLRLYDLRLMKKYKLKPKIFPLLKEVLHQNIQHCAALFVYLVKLDNLEKFTLAFCATVKSYYLQI